MERNKYPTLKNKPMYIEIYDENTLEEEANGNNIIDTAAIANQLAGLSANSDTPLHRFDDPTSDEDGVVLKNAANVTALIVKYQPNARQSSFSNKRPSIPKPRMVVSIPNLNVVDNKILQSFYAKNLGKLKIKCQFEEIHDLYRVFRDLFKEGKMDFEFTGNLAGKEEEIKKIIAEYEDFLDHSEKAPPPKLLF